MPSLLTMTCRKILIYVWILSTALNRVSWFGSMVLAWIWDTYWWDHRHQPSMHMVTNITESNSKTQPLSILVLLITSLCIKASPLILNCSWMKTWTVDGVVLSKNRNKAKNKTKQTNNQCKTDNHKTTEMGKDHNQRTPKRFQKKNTKS